MGIFDQLLKSGSELLKEVTSEENKEAANELLKNLKAVVDEHKDDIKEFMDSVREEAKKAEEKMEEEEKYYEEYEDGKTCRQRILDILASEFPSYTVRENVSPATIGGTGRFMDYSIVVYDGAEPKLFIMIIGKTTTSHREYRWSRQEAEKNGYAFINFIEHYPNNPDYITNRLHKYL